MNVLENGGTLSEDSLEQAPKAIKDAIKQGSQIIFKSNAGPQEEFLAAPEKEVL
mgnify:CR=1 FL=1